ncbi:MAG: hypothetical protein K2W96_10435 [Gemmataceae bacterium]|nr:hypothetical protein [Gemmataceae bacterium]
MASADRAGVTGAAHAIDLLPAVDPDQRGVPNFDTVRTLVHAPLGVDFEVVAADRIVYVLTVWELP